MTRARFIQGRRIVSMKDFVECNEPWYKYGRATRSRAVLEHMTYDTLKRAIDNCIVYVAEEIGRGKK